VATIDFIVRNGLQVYGNVGIGTTSNSGIGAGNVSAVFGKSYYAGNIQIANTSTISGILFADGTYQNTASYRAAFSASNLTVTATSTDSTFYVAFFEGTTANIGARVNNSFTYNPAKNTISLGNIVSSKWEGQVIAASYGGTGISSYTQGDLLYASSATTLSTLNSVGTGVGPGNVLVNGVSGPSWGSLDLSSSSAVKNTLGVTYGGTGTSTQFTLGSVVFAGASGVYTQDNANFFWDDTNNRLGLGTASPSQTLDVNGSVLLRSNAQVLGNLVVNNSMRTGNLSITNTTAATSTTTGALIVSGGMGLAGNAFIGGNIGIGTSATQGYRLYTLGNSKVTGSVEVDISFLGQPNDTVTTPSYSWTGDQSTGMFRPSSGNIGLSTNGIERVRISKDGFVGIGTGLPVAKLQVSGNTIVSNVMLYSGFSYGGSNLDISSIDSGLTGVWVSNDGTLIYTIGPNADRIRVFQMTTPWELSTATYLGQTSITVSAENSNPQGLVMKPDGRRAWMTGTTATNGNVGVYEYDLDSPWVITSGFSYNNNILVTTSAVALPTAAFWKPDGLRLFVLNGNSLSGTAPRSVVEYAATIPWTIGSMSNTIVSSFSIAVQEISGQGLSFTGDGTRMFILGANGDDVTIYDLATPWQISTASYRTEYSLTSLVPSLTSPWDIFVSPDGAKMYVTNDIGAGTGNVVVYQFEMPITTVDMVGTVKISGSASIAQDLTAYGKLSVGSSALFAGNVGIGTTDSRGYSLYANGNIKSTGSIDVNGSIITGNAIRGGNLSITNATAATSTSSGAVIVAGGVGVAGNVYAGNLYATTFYGAANTAINASNIVVTATTTNATFYPTFVEATSGNLGIRTDTTFTYNPSTDALTAGQFIPSGSTAPANGMFLPTTNTVGFATDSSERIRITSSGSVGIGTSTISSGNVTSIYGGNLFIAGNLRVGNTATTIGGIQFPDGTFQSTAAVPPSTATTMSIASQTASTAYYPVFVAGTGAQAEYINTTSLQVIPNSGNIISIGSAYFGNIGVTNTTAATSTTTGAVIVAGGIGVTGNVYAGNVYATTFYGAANTAINASNITVINTATSGATFYVPFVDATSGNLSLRADNTLTYTPSTDSLTAGKFIPTSTSAPSVGMYAVSAGVLALATATTERMRITTDGNIAIGSSTGVNARLTIQAPSVSTSTNRTVYLTNGTQWLAHLPYSSAGAYNPIVQAGDHGIIWTNGTIDTGNLTIGQWSNSNRGMRFDQYGNLSIGTSTVGYPIANRTSVTINGTSQSLLGLYAGGALKGYLYTDGTNIATSADAGSYSINGSTGIIFQTASAENMRLDTNGNLAIGTSSTAGGPLYIYRATNLAQAPYLSFDGGSTAQYKITRYLTNTVVRWDMGVNNTSESGSNAGSDFYISAFSDAGAYLFSPVSIARSTGRSTFYTELAVANTLSFGGQIRMISGSYGALWRNDGSNIYLLFTNSGDQYGTWNSLRPFYASVTTGRVNLGNGLDVTGAITATGEITAYSSDSRLKTNVSVINNALDKLSMIKGVMFDWKDNVSSLGFVPGKTHDVGVIAQDVEAVLPEAVRPAPFDLNEERTGSKSGENYLTVQYEKLTALLIEAVKEQQAIIEDQGNRITRLESMINPA
jgi:hypothetical protein